MATPMEKLAALREFFGKTNQSMELSRELQQMRNAIGVKETLEGTCNIVEQLDALVAATGVSVNGPATPLTVPVTPAVAACVAASR